MLLEILAILVGIVGTLFTIVKLVHSHKEKTEKHKLQIKTSKAELLELFSNYLDLHPKLDAKFTDKYLASLKEVLTEDEYSQLQARLTLMRLNMKLADTGKMIFLKLDNETEAKIDKERDMLLKIAKMEGLIRGDIVIAKQLLSSRVIAGAYLPIDESLSGHQE